LEVEQKSRFPADCNGGRKTSGQSAPDRDENLIRAIAGEAVVAKGADSAENGSDVGLIIETARIKPRLA